MKASPWPKPLATATTPSTAPPVNSSWPPPSTAHGQTAGRPSRPSGGTQSLLDMIRGQLTRPGARASRSDHERVRTAAGLRQGRSTATVAAGTPSLAYPAELRRWWTVTGDSRARPDSLNTFVRSGRQAFWFTTRHFTEARRSRFETWPLDEGVAQWVEPRFFLRLVPTECCLQLGVGQPQRGIMESGDTANLPHSLR